MKQLKKCAAALLLLAALLSALPAQAAGPNGEFKLNRYNEQTEEYDQITVDRVKLVLDGKEMDFTGDIPPVVQNINGFGRTLVPFRAVGEALGATVFWSQENRQAILRKGSTTIVLTMGSDMAAVNGAAVPLPDGVAACAMFYPGDAYGRTMIPLRFVSEQLGCQVEWLQESYTAKIASPAAAPQITRVTADEDAQTVLIATDRKVDYKVADYGGKIVVDLLGAELASGFPGTITVDNDFITTVRYAWHGKDFYEGYDQCVRVVLDLKEGLTLEENAKVEQTGEGVLLTTFRGEDDPPEHPPITLPTIDPSKKTIVVDAGHGGSRAGAVYEGIQEKDLTLKMAKLLESKLLKLGYNVVMTRTTDIYMDLYERSDIANAAKADLFVSIHCNASATNYDFQGIFTYHHPSSNRGKDLGLTLQPYMAGATGGIDRGVLSADFVVLRETEMCAVLIETGFMTNHEELMNLVDPDYQDKITTGMAEGITAYLNKLG